MVFLKPTCKKIVAKDFQATLSPIIEVENGYVWKVQIFFGNTAISHWNMIMILWEEGYWWGSLYPKLPEIEIHSVGLSFQS